MWAPAKPFKAKHLGGVWDHPMCVGDPGTAGNWSGGPPKIGSFQLHCQTSPEFSTASMRAAMCLGIVPDTLCNCRTHPTQKSPCHRVNLRNFYHTSHMPKYGCWRLHHRMHSRPHQTQQQFTLIIVTLFRGSTSLPRTALAHTNIYKHPHPNILSMQIMIVRTRTQSPNCISTLTHPRCHCSTTNIPRAASPWPRTSHTMPLILHRRILLLGDTPKSAS